MKPHGFTATDVEIVGKEPLHRGHVTLDRYKIKHRLFSGGWSGEFTRELMHRGQAAGVVLFDPLRDEVVLVEQFRIGPYVAGRAAWQIEIVCGVIDDGETAESVVRREALEESGCAVMDLRPIFEIIASPGLMTETVALYCGRVDASNAGGVHGLDGENEDIRAFAASCDDVFDALGGGGITHGPSIVALQWLQIHHDDVADAWG